MSIQSEFKAGHVGKLCERHEQLDVSRKEQAAIPSQGSQREQQQQQSSQPGNGGTQ